MALIAVIDSGIGGLTVLKRLRNDFKGFNFVYYGDNENVPYGNKTINELKDRLENILNDLSSYNPDCLVVACNTLSVTFENDLLKYEIPVVLTLPPYNKQGDYLLCTPNTSNSGYVKKNFGGNVLPLPLLASEIERNVLNLSNVRVDYDLKGVPNYAKRLVLGCTHYLYLEEKIASLSGLEVVNGLDEVVLKVDKVVKNKALKNKSCFGDIEFVGNFGTYNSKIYYEVLEGK